MFELLEEHWCKLHLLELNVKANIRQSFLLLSFHGFQNYRPNFCRLVKATLIPHPEEVTSSSMKNQFDKRSSKKKKKGTQVRLTSLPQTEPWDS